MAALASLIAPSAQATPNLQATLDANDPTRPVLTLKNTSGEPCQITNTALGAVAITEVRQADKPVQPHYMETSFDQPLDIILEEELQTLKPGESATIDLRSFPIGDGHSLESISWSPEAGAYGLRYPISAGQPLDVELSYSVPIEADGAPICSPASIIHRPPSAFSLHWFYVAGIGFIILLVMALVVWLVRKKIISKKQAVSVLLLFGICGSLAAPPRVFADVNVPESLSGQWAECMATLEANRDITGPVLDVINNPDITIDIVPDERSDAARYGENHYRIYWDTRENTAYGGGGNLVPRDPCTGLYHEMYHVFDMHSGTYSRKPCGSSGIDTKEVMATRAQNVLRERLGMEPRTHYGHEPLPEGDCTDRGDEKQCPEGGCGESNGDPHLTTFDGLRYSFQAAGEFTLAKGGDFEIQVRQEPWLDSRRVAVTTAAAMRLGQDRLELRQQSGSLRLLINGETRELKNTSLAAGSIKSGSNSATVQLPDETRVTIQTLGSYGLRVLIGPSKDRQEEFTGLLGNNDGKKEKDLQYRDGNETIEPEFSQLYPGFADSWRVNAETSLFTYENGQNTDTFTDRSFPDEAATHTNAPNRAAAEQFCRSLGVHEEVSLQNCIVDVGNTSRPEFARAALQSQRLTAEKRSSDLVDLTVATPGKAAAHTFMAEKGQRVFITATTHMANQCSPLQLVDPNGRTIDSSCITDGHGTISSDILEVSGKYAVKFSPTGNSTGSLSTEITLSRDITRPINIGDTVAISIDRPGQVAHFTFSGERGQRLQLELMTTLPDQCGGFGVRAKNGETISSLCLSGGHATSAVTLPATGSYTLTVNPSQDATGDVTLKITPG